MPTVSRIRIFTFSRLFFLLLGLLILFSAFMSPVFPRLAAGLLDLLYFKEPCRLWGQLLLRLLEILIGAGTLQGLLSDLRSFWLVYSGYVSGYGLGPSIKVFFSNWSSVLVVWLSVGFVALWGLGVWAGYRGIVKSAQLFRLLFWIISARIRGAILKRGGWKRLESFLSLGPSERVRKAALWLFERALPYPASLFHHEAKTGGLFEHCLDVARHALKLSEREKLDPKEREILICAALLHDVGKIRQFAYQGPTTRWEGEGGTEGFLKFLTVPDYGPRKWIRLGRTENHWEIGAKIVAEELFQDEDRIFVSRVVHLIREHHSDTPTRDKLLGLLIEADRIMTGEEQNELKELVRENMRGVIRSFVPNLPVDGKVMLIWTPDLPDVLFANSFYLRDKILEFVRDLGFTVPQRKLFKKVSVLDQTIWEVVEEQGWRRELPGVSARDKLIAVKLGKVEFKLLPLALEKFFTRQEVERFPPYPYEISLIEASLKGGAVSQDLPKQAEVETSGAKAVSGPEPVEKANLGPQDVSPQKLLELWVQRYGTSLVTPQQVSEMLRELGADVPKHPRGVVKYVKELQGLEAKDGGKWSVKTVIRKGRTNYILELERPPESSKRHKD